MCDVIKIRLKRRIITRSGKGNQPLNIKTDVKRPILKLGLSFFFLLVASLLLRLILMTSHMTLTSASQQGQLSTWITCFIGKRGGSRKLYLQG